MGVLSKLLNEEWAVYYNCYEIGHVWTPHCSEAALDIFFSALVESLKMYTPLYVLSQGVFARKFDAASFKETFSSILRSSFFLSSNALTIILFFCLTRSMMGKFYYRVHAYIPCFVGAILSILIEKPSRRAPLAIYVANIASECLFRMYAEKGTIRTVPRGEVLIFTASMSVLLYLIKRQGYGSDPVSLALRFYLGRAEAAKTLRRAHSKEVEECPPVAEVNRNVLELGYNELDNKIVDHPSGFLAKNKPIKEAQQMSTQLAAHLGRHVSCGHEESSCLSYTLRGFAVPFGATWLGHVALNVLKRYRKVLASPLSTVMDIAQSKNSLKFALFFGTFSAVYKASSCLLRRHSNGSRDWHALVGGALAGPSMLLYPNTTITLYLFWKCVETLYWNGVHAGKFKNPELTAIIVYGLSVSQIAYCVLLQPKHMRPSYMKFIDQMTGHKFHLVNRFALNVLVPDAVQGYEDYFPDLDLRLCSNKFKETVFAWLLECKD